MKIFTKIYYSNFFKLIRKFIPKFLLKKINKNFFPYYFLSTDYQDLPNINYINSNNFKMQEYLIKKFKITNKQNSFMTCPYLHKLLLMKFESNQSFTFLDIGGENIDFFLQLKKNYTKVKYYVFNLEKINFDFVKLKKKYKYKNLFVIKKIDEIFNKKFDFINFGSCIQYLNNFEIILDNITQASNNIFFSGTILFDSNKKKYKTKIVVKQVNVFPEINYCYFFNKKFFYNFFYKKNFNLLFESQNLTDKVNLKNFNNLFKNIEYKDFFFQKKVSKIIKN